METYTLLREFADSWMLLALTLVFLAVFGWAWRPGSRKLHDDAANSIFRDDTKPGPDPEARPARASARRPQQEA